MKSLSNHERQRITASGGAREGRWRAAAMAVVVTVLGVLGGISEPVLAHGDVTPQAVDTRELKSLGADWLATNPYKGDKKAIAIGASAYNQNCARCHGLEAISGGIAPDLRLLDKDCMNLANEARKSACFKEIDEYFLSSVRRGKTRNGAVYMPPYEGILNQEAFWAIKSYLETRRASK